MTKDGEFHPVWYNKAVKWNVFLGGTIEGEVRVRFLGTTTKQTRHDSNDDDDDNDDGAEQQTTTTRNTTSPKMERLLQIARSYNCDMSLYGNNCRMFTARMERE